MSFYTVFDNNIDPRIIEFSLTALRQGGVVLAPSETGYCFLADATKSKSYDQLYKIRKVHPKNKPFSLMVSNLTLLGDICELNTAYYRMAKRLLPGPYTLVFRCNRRTPQYSKSQPRKTVGIRIPHHSFLIELTKEWGQPLITTSATDGEEILQDDYFGQSQDPDAWWTTATGIISKLGQVCQIAIETTYPIPLRVSTVIDCTEDSPQIIRDGGWPLNEGLTKN